MFDEMKTCLSPVSAAVFAVNQSVDAADREALQSSLTHSDIYLHSVTPECTDTYLENLQALKKEKSAAGGWRFQTDRLTSTDVWFIGGWEYIYFPPKSTSWMTLCPSLKSVLKVQSTQDKLPKGFDMLIWYLHAMKTNLQTLICFGCWPLIPQPFQPQLQPIFCLIQRKVLGLREIVCWVLWGLHLEITAANQFYRHFHHICMCKISLIQML